MAMNENPDTNAAQSHPLGVKPGESIIWNGLRLDRQPSPVQIAWHYRVWADSQLYRIIMRRLKEQGFLLCVWRGEEWEGRLLWQRIEATTPEEALHYALAVVRGVHSQGPPSILGQGTPPPTVFAALTLFGDVPHVESAMAEAGLAPSEQFPPPEVLRLHHLNPNRYGHWSLHSDPDLVSADLADHLGCLLDRLEAVKERLPPWVTTDEAHDHTDPSSIYASLSCHWPIPGDVPSLDAALLRRLADFGLSLTLCAAPIDENDDSEDDSLL